jgi:hypothetical protein
MEVMEINEPAVLRLYGMFMTAYDADARWREADEDLTTASTQVLPMPWSPPESAHGSAYLFPGASDDEIDEYGDLADRLFEVARSACHAAGSEFWTAHARMMATVHLLNGMDGLLYPSIAGTYTIAGWDEYSWREWTFRRLMYRMPAIGSGGLNVHLAEMFRPV